MKKKVAKKTYTKIATHPDRSTIIRMLNQGQGVRKISRFLKEKYPGEKKLHVSTVTLQDFRKNKLNIQGDALLQIKKAQREKKEEREEKKSETKIKTIPAYREAIQKAAEMHVDIRQELSEMIVLIKTKMEEFFDKASDGEATRTDEELLQKYFPLLGEALAKWMKYVEKVADQTVETNINITVIEDQMAVIRDAVRETFMDMDPALAIKFLDNLNKKMDALQYKRQPLSFDSLHNQTKKLSSKVIDVGEQYGD